jgi:peptidoglycan/xylan/chitin deacetylase (PgdA/CDA1 family)
MENIYPSKFSNGVYINSGEKLFEKKLLRFEVLDDNLRPAWLAEKEEVPIILDSVFQNKFDSEVLAVFKDENNKRYPAIVRNEDRIIYNFDPVRAMNFLLSESYISRKFIDNFSFVNFLSCLIPAYLRRHFKRLYYLLLKGSDTGFPSWPVEKSLELVRFVLARSQNKKNKISWPENKKFALALTHDVDSKKGISNIDRLLEVEKSYNVTSTWFIVSRQLFRNTNFIDRLMNERHEIGLHGIRHSYTDTDGIRQDLLNSEDIFRRFNIKGFRAPFLTRSAKLFRALKGLFHYDSSVPDAALLSPQPYRTGSCCIFPYKVAGLLELPITLPLDSSLIFLGYRDMRILDLWMRKIEWIRQVGGIAVLDTHPEPHFSGSKEMVRLYDKFLNRLLKDDSAWVVNLSEIAKFWGETQVPLEYQLEYEL